MARIVKAIIPNKLNWEAMQKQFADAMTPVKETIVEELEKVTSTWEPPPTFNARVSRGTSQPLFYVDVWTDDERFLWVNEGTKPHVIVPKHAKFLSFGVGGSPKSSPKKLQAYKGKKGTKRVYAKRVNHPGTKARDFTGKITKKREPWFRARIREALRNAVKAGGHGL